jgi:predicted O-linked N-acetylglucosamine transferase (SPINDLY family)
LADNPTAVGNLRREAVSRGVSSERLVFAERMDLPEHLARHQAADLFIDTWPCNAHTTASDALWAGLPVLTCAGEVFASRVASSLLAAIRLPELIAASPEQYEELAVHLAADRERLAHIRQTLADNRLTTPLFDTRLYAQYLEAAYAQMYERHQADLAPEHIYLERS